MKALPALGRGIVSPCLMVESIQAELQFLKTVFGARVRQLRGGHENNLWQVQVLLGDCILLVGSANKGSPPAAGTLYVWTDDVEATYARAIEAGATLISAPTEQPSGVREAGFRDPEGNVWWIGRQRQKPSNREVERRLAEQRRKRL